MQTALLTFDDAVFIDHYVFKNEIKTTGKYPLKKNAEFVQVASAFFQRKKVLNQ